MVARFVVKNKKIITKFKKGDILYKPGYIDITRLIVTVNKSIDLYEILSGQFFMKLSFSYIEKEYKLLTDIFRDEI